MKNYVLQQKYSTIRWKKIYNAVISNAIKNAVLIRVVIKNLYPNITEKYLIETNVNLAIKL